MRRVLLPLTLWVAAVLPAQADYSHAPGVPQMLKNLRIEHGFTPPELAAVRVALRQAKQVPALLKAEKNAKEKTLSWAAYEPIAVNATNVRNGAAFVRAQRHWMSRAEADYGVQPSVIAALLGVETKYGHYTGGRSVLNALSTLAFDHPTRGPFFRSELENLFVLCRDQHCDPTTLRGSYAGAMGMAQFMPSSELRFGRDFNDDGRVDLWTTADAIGSVANYLANHDTRRAWQRDMPLIVPATVDGTLPDGIKVNGKYPDTTVGALTQQGLRPAVPLPGNLAAGLVRLDTDDGPRYWIALTNFYAVMAYNPRTFYAMSVALLAQRIDAAAAAGREGG
jgi:lytic murein transglycosylase B